MVLYFCVLIVFSLHRESLKLILVTELLPEVVLSHMFDVGTSEETALQDESVADHLGAEHEVDSLEHLPPEIDTDPGVDSVAATPGLGAGARGNSSEGAMCSTVTTLVDLLHPTRLNLLHHWCIRALLRSWVLDLLLLPPMWLSYSTLAQHLDPAWYSIA
jgi:hypothetical protein